MNDRLLPVRGEEEVGWRALSFFSGYRLIITLLFAALAWVAEVPEPLGVFDQSLFDVTVHAYLLAAVLFFIPLRLRLPPFPYQVTGQVLADILAITLIMYASAGVSSGFGILLMIVVAGGSLLKPGRIAYFFAAVATIAVLGEELYAELVRFYPQPNYTHAAVLGITYFITAFICHALAIRIRESEALAESRAIDIQNLALLNEQIVQHMQSGVLVLDSDARIRLINKSAYNLLGLKDDVIGNSIAEVSGELDKLFSRWREQDADLPAVIRPENGVADVQVSFRKLTSRPQSGILIFLEDASMLRQRAQQLKMASLGRMAASIAHEVRNPLGAISHAGQLLSESTNLGVADKRLIAIIQDHSWRVNDIVENVMRVSRREPAIPQQIDIKSWLAGFSADFSAQNNLNEDDIRIQVIPEDIKITVDQSQLYQIMTNLCSNGIRYSRGTPLLEIRCETHAELQRPYIDVIDHGPGMPAEIAEHVFEPFVTSESQGTGLGLYIARELCEANQATLNLYENTAQGCRFRINFAHPDKHHIVQ